jgi:hypothetical protein
MTEPDVRCPHCKQLVPCQAFLGVRFAELVAAAKAFEREAIAAGMASPVSTLHLIWQTLPYAATSPR